MKIDEQHLLPEHLAFYRRRWFWGVVFFIHFIINLILFHTLFSEASTMYEYYKILLSMLGAVSFGILIKIFFIGTEYYLHLFTSTIYTFVFLFFVYKTFAHKIVSVLYPICILINSVISSIILSLFLLL